MPNGSEPSGLVFAVSRTSAEDGPGIRTTVFMRGCPLRCVWCHSPQSQGAVHPRLAFYQNRCILCGACSSVCPQGAQLISSGTRRILWETCEHCGRCAQVCPSRALEMVGVWLTVDQVMDVVRRDAVYYDNSGGGVTFSGGEPTAQPHFLAVCAQRCRKEGIHTALDTCGFVEWTVLDTILPHIDLVLFDLKHMDSQEHQRLTGVSNDLILENLRRIDQRAKPIWIRIPLIPGHNDSLENLDRVAELARHLSAVEKVSILPYNTAAGANYHLIGRDYALEGLDHSQEREQDIRRIFANTEIEIEIER